ncbi:MAG: N-6 DNA methylase [Candidatus Omnitrophota bacterium]|nr:N-6 DNA methylase [Candidatus Omnitrophota bacterium]
MAKKNNNGNGKVINSQAAMTKAVKSICDILRRDKAKGARLYVPELTWMFFLRYLDIMEEKEEQKTKALGKKFEGTLVSPYRWRDWGAPYDFKISLKEAVSKKLQGWKRKELSEKSLGSYLSFVNDKLFPYLKELGEKPGASNKQKVISEIFRNKEKTILASETNLQNALDKIHALAETTISEQHIFPISQAFEGLLPSLGEKKNDGGQFFTPREIIRVIVNAIKPEVGRTVYDPCCGTGGFLIEAYKYMMKQNPTPTQIEELKTEILWGREDAGEAIPICLANMVLHEVDLPRIWHGNTLTGNVTYGDLFEGAPNQFDYVLTNPPFGSKEGKDAQAQFAYKSGKAQILFLQHIIDSLADGGTCGMVIDEGVMFHTKTAAYQQTKRKLLSECNLWCVISLPQGVFVNAGAGVKTDLFFFTKDQQTERVWYYDMTLTDDFKPRKVNKGNPLTYSDFHDFFERLALNPNNPKRISERSWYVSIDEIKEKKFDLKATNENAPDFSDKRNTAELIAIISDTQKQIEEGLRNLQK